MVTPIFNTAKVAANADCINAAGRNRTVPIPHTITPIPGYPQKLVVFKMAASQYWQVRCWVTGKTHRQSTRTQSLRMAQSYARRFYEHLIADQRSEETSLEFKIKQPEPKKTTPASTLSAIAAQMYTNEEARCNRGEIARSAIQVLRNRLDAHILPRWANTQVGEIDYNQLLAFTQFLSQKMTTTTVRQYLTVMRKVLTHAVRLGSLSKLPEFPKIRVVTTSRGAFTPSEYWKILRLARQRVGYQHPAAPKLIRSSYKVRTQDQRMPPDLAWAIGFMVNSFIRPSDLKTLKHKHVEIVRNNNTYLRLTLPETKSHGKPIVTLQPAVRIYQQICKHQAVHQRANPEDYLFLPHIRDRNYAGVVLSFHLNHVLDTLGLKLSPHGQPRTLYSFRHSAITFRLLYGQGIDVITLARNARTSVEIINAHYASSVTGEQNIAMLQSRRTRMAG